jgi:SAM-dependent methyltransferase
MTTAQLTATSACALSSHDAAVSLLCWNCDAVLGPLISLPESGSRGVLCAGCHAVTEYRAGIWLSLSPERAQYFNRFIADYELIRATEGRGSAESDYYLALPYKDISGRNSEQWHIRAQTFRYIERHVVNRLSAQHNRSLNILDLGAGNCWMSYRLALLGHAPVAVDLLVNNQDGLGAAIHFSRRVRPLFPRIQADLDDLPLGASTFDLVIFNASFHYSENFERTFAEALRCTRPGGAVLIADTPWYADEESGRRMIEEKRKNFVEKYGFPSDSISNLEFLTPERLGRIQASSGIRWQSFTPFYGLRWSLRPLRARIHNRRPPSKFRIYVGWVTG